MISQTAEYALRAVVWLASRPDEAFTAQALAAHIHVPAGYLAKVMHSLVRARLLVSQRGRNGGFRLRGKAAGISVLDIVDAVDPIRRIRSCPLGLATHGLRLCPLHRRLDEAIAMVRKAFGGATVAELLAESSSSPLLCERRSRRGARVAARKSVGR
jgi:Rrf2 family protein